MAQKILVVDDDPLQVDLIKRLFKMSYDVSAAQNGREAIQKVYDDAPDFIILDYMMPDIDGLEVLKQVRATPNIKQPQILVLTAHTRALDRVQTLLAGANDYMSKPFNSMDLISRVTALMYKH